MIEKNPIEQVLGEFSAVTESNNVWFGDNIPVGEDDSLEGLLDRPSKLLSLESADVVAAMDPEQRIERLFANMYSYKRDLLAVIAGCKTPCSFDQISKLIAHTQKSAQSVYAAESILDMLIDAGALERVTAQGTPYVQTKVDPNEVERDGRVYLTIAEPPEAFWQATPAGLQALKKYDSMKAVEELFSKQPDFLSSYAVLLRLCARDEGANIKTLKEIVNERPEIIGHKKTAQFLLENLSQAGVLAYDADCKVWRTNKTGDSILRLLETQ